METNIIGIDGSLSNFGISVCKVNFLTKEVKDVIHLELSETKPDNSKGVRRSTDDLARFRQHWLKVNSLIVKFDCKGAIAEIPSGAQDARAQFAFGGITAMMACLPVPLTPITPLEAKAATGSKHADKEDVIEWAYNLFPKADWFVSKKPNKMDIKTPAGLYLQLKNEHLADSIAITYAGLHKLQIK